MNPDDIPTEITKLTYRRTSALQQAGLPVLSQNQTAELLAHFWPAIEAHLREQIAQEIEALATAGYGTPVTAGMQMALNVVRRTIT